MDGQSLDEDEDEDELLLSRNRTGVGTVTFFNRKLRVKQPTNKPQEVVLGADRSGNTVIGRRRPHTTSLLHNWPSGHTSVSWRLESESFAREAVCFTEARESGSKETELIRVDYLERKLPYRRMDYLERKLPPHGLLGKKTTAAWTTWKENYPQIPLTNTWLSNLCRTHVGY